MLAFLDAEFNCGTTRKDRKKDMSLIDVALIVVESFESQRIMESYQSFCRPMKNNGLLYPIIKGLTHIKQSDVDKGKSFVQVYEDLAHLIDKYNITTIYVWGNFDKHALMWNCTNCPEAIDGRKLTNKIVDISRECVKKIGLSKDMSLGNIAYICECDADEHHNALADTEILTNVVLRLYSNNYDRKKLLEYDRYVQQREAYNALKKAVMKVKSVGGDVDQFFKMADREQGFPKFNY